MEDVSKMRFLEKSKQFSKLSLYNILSLDKNSTNLNNLKLITNYSEISEFLTISNKNIFNSLYLNKTNIHKILYNEEKFINIIFNEENKNIANYFYLVLLIQEDKNIINYIYNIDFIEKVNSFQETIDNSLIYKKIIIAILLANIIINYKSSNIYSKSDDEKLNDIRKKNEFFIENNINHLKELIPELNKNYILKEKIDKIYSNIIIACLFQDKNKDIRKIETIFEQLDLESINLTEMMVDELSNKFKINNNFVKQYMINNILDLFNIKKIDFYYVLFKYLFKNKMYVYVFPFLKEARNTLLKIKNDNLDMQLFFNIEKESKNKLEYILRKILDSEFYYITFFKEKLNVRQIENKLNNARDYSTHSISENFTNNNKSNTNSEDKNLDNKKNQKSESNGRKSEHSEQYSSLIKLHISDSISSIDNSDIKQKNYIPNDDNGEYSIIKLKDKLSISNNQTFEIVKELKNKTFLAFGSDTKIYILNIEDNRLIIKKDVNICNSWINNIIGKDEESREGIIVSTENKLYLIKDFDKKPEFIDITLEDNNNFIIKIKENNFVICQKNINSVIKINDLLDKNLFLSVEEIKNKEFFKAGIKINNKIVALVSNRIKGNGKDKINFCNVNTKNTLKEFGNYSFILSSNGLYLISDYNILLCACKKYIKGQKNGILLISNLNLIDKKYDDKNNVIFYETYDFEVHCFCQLFINENSNIFNKTLTKTDYILVGGFDTKRKRGCIKLFKIEIIKYTSKEKYFKLGEIQGIIDEINSPRRIFNGPISCIEQSTDNENIFVTCWDGNIFLFEKPNFQYLLEKTNSKLISFFLD